MEQGCVSQSLACNRALRSWTMRGPSNIVLSVIQFVKMSLITTEIINLAKRGNDTNLDPITPPKTFTPFLAPKCSSHMWSCPNNTRTLPFDKP
eukprot:451012-Amphidinium_carterae.1